LKLGTKDEKKQGSKPLFNPRKVDLLNVTQKNGLKRNKSNNRLKKKETPEEIKKN